MILFFIRRREKKVALMVIIMLTQDLSLKHRYSFDCKTTPHYETGTELVVGNYC